MNSITNSRSTWPKSILPVVLVGGLAAALFLIFSSRLSETGFPLDDAWIHQTYARNLAQLGEWAYIPGQPSAGSTAPAWSILLAVGHLLSRGTPFVWTFLLGTVCLIGIGLTGQAIVNHSESSASRWPIAGVLLAGEWHLVWAAVSGMETALMGLISILFFFLLVRGRIFWEALGLLIGASIWVRPDGLTLLGPAVFVLILYQQTGKKIVSSILRLILGFLLLAIPYLFFNRLVNGSFWPNTFYAKQAEYSILLSQPIWVRLGQQLFLPLAGVGLFFLPGFLFLFFDEFRRKSWPILSAGIWFLGYAGMYAIRLPVTYQHGRYLMPAMPVFFLLGWMGTARLLRLIPKKRLPFILTRTFIISVVLVWAAFLGIGAQAYATDVAVIQTEMVATAHWVAENTAPDDLIAAHDIGALGYFSQREILDLAGLISPQVIPFIRDEGRISAYLSSEHVDFLVTFPDWYPELTEGLTPVFQTQGRFAPEAGVENMAVYRWK